jgi:hypothetical protein
MATILGIGDLHEPYTHHRYLRFCKDVYRRFRCTQAVFLGDIADNHAISYHEHDPNLYSPGDELRIARRKIRKWVVAFPNAKVCEGNHDKLPFRKAMTCGLPFEWIRNYAKLWDTPGWDWQLEHIIDDVLYTHQRGSGVTAALNGAIKERMSVVIGHLHGQFGVKYTASKKDRIFGADCGCGIDVKKRAFAYGKEFAQKPILGCLVIKDGWYPQAIPMRLNGK